MNPSSNPTTSRVRSRSALLASAALLLALAAAGIHAPVAAQTPGPAPASEPDDDDDQDAGQAAGAMHVIAAEPDETLPPLDLTPQIMFQYLAAEVAAQRGDFGAATATMLSLARQTRDPRLARRATEFALAGRSLEYATQGARLWLELAPDSALAQRTVESLYLSSGRLEDAEPLIAARLARARADGSLPDFWRQLQSALVRVSDRQGALSMIERLAANDTGSAPARLAVAGVAAAAGRTDKAIGEARRALELDPGNEVAAVTLARMLATAPGGKSAATDVLQKFLQRQPRSVEARFAYARLLADDGRTDDARAQVDVALEQEPGNPALIFTSAQLAYQTKQLDRAKELMQRYLALPPSVTRDSNTARLFLAQIAEDQGRIPEAIEWLAGVADGEQWLAARIRRALLLGKLKRVDEARALLRETSVTTNRERVQLVAAEAQVLRDAGRNTEAFDVLDRALERLPSNPDLLYDQAMAAEKIDRLDTMEASLRRLIRINPEHAHAYNALGYTLADRNVRLDEAQELLAKALQLAPDDPHVLDSVGWLEYRRGRYDSAIQYLQRAYSLRAEPDIAAHLGEVFWKAGRADEARRIWREARVRQPDNETLRETLVRLNVDL